MEDPHRAQRPPAHAAAAGRPVRLSAARRESPRPVRRGSRRHGALGGVRDRHGAGLEGRAVQGRRGGGRRRAHLRPAVRGDEQRGSLGSRHHHDLERQRHVDRAQRRCHQQVLGLHHRQSDHGAHPRAHEGADLVRVPRRGRSEARRFRENDGGEHQELLVPRDAVRRARIPLLRADRRSQHRTDGPDPGDRENAQGPARGARHYRKRQRFPPAAARHGEVPRPRALRPRHGRAAARQGGAAAVDRGVRRSAGPARRRVPQARGDHRRHAIGHGDGRLPEKVARSLLRRRHRGGARRHLRRGARHTGHPPGRRDLFDVPAARVRQHHPRRGDPAAPRDLLPRPRRHGR